MWILEFFNWHWSLILWWIHNGLVGRTLYNCLLVQIWKCISISGEVSFFKSKKECQNWGTLMWIFWLLVPAICICVAIAFAWINEVTGGKQPWWPQHNLSITIRLYICRDQPQPAASSCCYLRLCITWKLNVQRVTGHFKFLTMHNVTMCIEFW